MKINRWNPPTTRNAFAAPVNVASQNAKAKEAYIKTAMMIRINTIAKVAAVRRRTTLSITSSFSLDELRNRLYVLVAR